MIYKYKGPFNFDKQTILDWHNSPKGVYYCGALAANGLLIPFYIGSAVGDGGIRDRLLDHINEKMWIGITHFGFMACDTIFEAHRLEREQIALYKPNYNVQGK